MNYSRNDVVKLINRIASREIPCADQEEIIKLGQDWLELDGRSSPAGEVLATAKENGFVAFYLGEALGLVTGAQKAVEGEFDCTGFSPLSRAYDILSEAIKSLRAAEQALLKVDKDLGPTRTYTDGVQ